MVFAGRMRRVRHVMFGLPALALALVLVALPACTRGVKDIPDSEIGHAYKVKFGTVLSARSISIRTYKTEGVSTAGVGALAFGGPVALTDPHSAEAIGASAAAGGLLALIARWNLETDNAVEYTIAFSDGSVQVIQQLQEKDDPFFDRGSAVMVKFGAERDLVMAAADLPDTVKAPKMVQVDTKEAKDNAKNNDLKVERCDTLKTKYKSGDSIEQKHCTKQ